MTLMEEVTADVGVRLIMKDWPIFGGASVTAAQMVLGGVPRGEYAAAQAALMSSYRSERSRWDGLMARNGAQAPALGLQGTPAFFTGYGIHAGALDGAQLRAAIAEARANA